MEAAELVLYNTCSIRDKAEQKVFHRLQQFKREAGKGKVFGVLGCVAQQEGEKIFEKAPHVSLVAGSASYTKLPQMLIQLEAGSRRVTGLSLDTDETFETPFTRRDNPHRAYITIIEGCDKVVRLLRGAVHARTGAQPHQRQRDGGGARLAERGYSEIQLLGQNVNSYRDPSPAGWDFATLLARVGEVAGIRRVRFTTSHPRDFVKPIVDAMDAIPALCNHVHLPVQSGSTRVLAAHAAPLYARRIHAPHRVDEERAPRHIAITTDIIVGFPGRNRAGFRRDARAARRSGIRFAVRLQVFAAPQHAPPSPWPTTSPEEEKTRRLTIVQEKQRAIQIRRNSDSIGTRGRGACRGPQPGAGSVDRTHFAEPHAEFHACRREAGICMRQVPAGPRDAGGPEFLAGESVVTHSV